jgi:hypothetical protein
MSQTLCTFVEVSYIACYLPLSGYLLLGYLTVPPLFASYTKE